MKYQSRNLSFLQNALSFLQYLESGGAKTIEDAKRELYVEIETRVKSQHTFRSNARLQKMREKKVERKKKEIRTKHKINSMDDCPSCGAGKVVFITTPEGDVVAICTKVSGGRFLHGCGFSKMVKA